jgi:hypothetical protein
MKKIILWLSLLIAVAALGCSTGLTEAEVREIIRSQVDCHTHAISISGHQHINPYPEHDHKWIFESGTKSSRAGEIDEDTGKPEHCSVEEPIDEPVDSDRRIEPTVEETRPETLTPDPDTQELIPTPAPAFIPGRCFFGCNSSPVPQPTPTPPATQSQARQWEIVSASLTAEDLRALRKVWEGGFLSDEEEESLRAVHQNHQLGEPNFNAWMKRRLRQIQTNAAVDAVRA